MEKITIDETSLYQEISEYIRDCDADELAGVAGYIFGGKCEVRFLEEEESFTSPIAEDYVYEFTPDADLNPFDYKLTHSVI